LQYGQIDQGQRSKKTYKANFGETPFGDITKEETQKAA
jgi:hypothetical protein